MTTPLGTRAVDRPIDPGNYEKCISCNKEVKFEAKKKLRQVVANVYEDGKWDRVEHWHKICYEKQDCPYGKPIPGPRFGSRNVPVLGG